MKMFVLNNNLFETMKKLLLYLAAAIISIAYSWPYANHFMDGDFEMQLKPFIYRQFSIRVIYFLQHATGLEYGQSAAIFIMVFSVLYVSSILYLLNGIMPQIKQKEILALLIFCVFCILFMYEMKPYDVSISFFFTLALAYLAHGKSNHYLLVFLIACTQKETAIFLIVIFAFYCWRQDIDGYWIILFTQIVSYFYIQLTIKTIFQDAPGKEIWYSFFDNLVVYQANIFAAWVISCVLVLWVLVIQYGWNYKDRLLRIAFVQMFSFTFILFALFGQPFEFRVFAEVLPVSAILLVRP